MSAVFELAWPKERLGEGLVRLAHASGRAAPDSDARASVPLPPAGSALDGWLQRTVSALGLEIEPVQAPARELDTLVRRSAPAVLRVARPAGDVRYLCVLRGGRRRVVVIDPEGRERRLAVASVASAMRADLEAACAERFDALARRASTGAHGAGAHGGGALDGKARAAWVRDRAGRRSIGGCFLLTAPPGASFPRVLRRAGLVGRVVAMAALHVLASALFLASWYALGRGVLSGHFDAGWALAWSLLLLSVVPCRSAASWLEARASLGIGAALKRRWIAGGLALDGDEVRSQGAGRLLSRVLEGQALESVALGASFQGLRASIELVSALVVCTLGPAPLWTTLALVLWVALLALAGRGHLARLRAWAAARIEVTADLVERLVGHRTRLAQCAPEEVHAGEDEGLERTLRRTRGLDRSLLLLRAVLPGAWPVAGVLTLAPAVLAGETSRGALAVGLGAVLLAQGALRSLGTVIAQVNECRVAWGWVRTHFEAARQALPGACESAPDGDVAEGEELLGVHGVHYRHRGAGRDLFGSVDFAVRAGDRVLLQGPSGSGKSTLAALLAGLREPAAGLVLLRGLDRGVLGDGNWRRRVPLVPQFHDNHLFSASLAFNLLLARQWPPAPGDLEEAEAVCRELGLGPLLERLPGGLDQDVGETGWQLSHGERSRVFLARALLQGGDVAILDESLAALDAGSLRRAVECVVARTRACVVVAHP